MSQALNIWIIQIVVAIGPPLGALAFMVYLKTDWGISLFFLTPLALVAIPALRLPKIALVRYHRDLACRSRSRCWPPSPYIAAREMADNPNGASGYGARSELARELTRSLAPAFRFALGGGRRRHGNRRADDVLQPGSSRDRITPDEIWSSGLTSLEEAKRLGFIGICEHRTSVCRRARRGWRPMRPTPRQLVMTTRRFFNGHAGPATSWKVYIVPPAK